MSCPKFGEQTILALSLNGHPVAFEEARLVELTESTMIIVSVDPPIPAVLRETGPVHCHVTLETHEHEGVGEILAPYRSRGPAAIEVRGWHAGHAGDAP